MENITKLETFKKELNVISDKEVKDIVRNALLKADDKFFTAPASSTGKYHPAYALGEGGLVRHTQAAVKFACELLSLSHNSISSIDHDYVIAALILHDTCKSGVKWGDKHTIHEHPVLVKQLLSDTELTAGQLEHWNVICELISSHMGQWNTSKYSQDILPLPKTHLQRFVHECDYLASRNFIHLTIFDENVTDSHTSESATSWRDTEPTENQITTIRRWLYKATSRITAREYDDISNKLESSTFTKGEASDIITKLKVAVEGESTPAQLESLEKCLCNSKLRDKLSDKDIHDIEWSIKNPKGLTKAKAQLLLSKAYN